MRPLALNVEVRFGEIQFKLIVIPASRMIRNIEEERSFRFLIE